MLNPIEKFKVAILHLNGDQMIGNCLWLAMLDKCLLPIT